METKQRHGCVTVWLILMIIANSLLVLVNLIWSDDIAHVTNMPYTILILFVIFEIINIICAVLLLRWKKLGFWGFMLSGISIFAVNLNYGVNPEQTFGGLLGLLVLYGILQIKKNGVSAWNNLE